MPSTAGPSSPSAALADALDSSARLVDRHLLDDRCFPDLSELLSVPSHSKSRWSTSQEYKGVKSRDIGYIVRVYFCQPR
uniref:Uncharacterized protein n=1 Tax=Hippocampus comes TaxID=109280 RepID=A0A3Q3DLT1_HIPCM